MSESHNVLFTAGTLLSRDGLAVADKFYGTRTLVNLLNAEELLHLKNYVPALLPYYLAELNALNPATFRFLDEASQNDLKNKLILTYFLLYAQYQLDSTYGRQYNLQAYKNAMESCAALMDTLKQTSDNPNGSPEQGHGLAQASTEKYLKFTGIIVGQWLAARLAELYRINEGPGEHPNQTYAGLETTEAGKVAQGEFASGNTAFIKKWMGLINERRLYWVWGGGMLSCVLDLLPNDFFNKPQTQTAIGTPSPFTGYMSWLLYYARFALNLSLLLKHTFVGPWMNPEEREAAKSTTAWQRFSDEFKVRKFALLNDSIWATANLLCFFWLKGSGWLGWGGNVATAALLAMDLILSVVRYFEEETQHRRRIKRLEDALSQLPSTKENEARINELSEAIAQANFDWKYKKYSLINDIAYAGGLLAAFALVCCGFAPPGLIAAATLAVVAVVGAALCFAFTVAGAAIASGIEISKTKATAAQIKEKYHTCFEKFTASKNELKRLELLVEPEPLINFVDDRADRIQKLNADMHVYYLMLKDYEAEAHYHSRMAQFQSAKLIRSVFIDACIPALIFACFTFMPLPVAIGVVAAGVLLAGLSYLLINRFEPKAAEKAVLESEDHGYQAFVDNPVNLFGKEKKESKSGFFATQAAPSPTTSAGNGNEPPGSAPASDLLIL